MKRRIGLVLLAWIVIPWTAGTALDISKAKRRRAAEAAATGEEPAPSPAA